MLSIISLAMSQHDAHSSPPRGEPRQERDFFDENLRAIERKDWQIWATTIFVMLLLSVGVVSIALPSLRLGATTVLHITVDEAISGLIALVVLFNAYILYQQVLIKRLRRQLAEKQGHSHLLRNMAMVDVLTGLYNRRFAEQRLAAEVARSSRKGHPLTVVLLDLNNFKHINDAHGHPAGDLVLQEFAACLNRAIRKGDLAVRMGGDEFLLVLPECNLEQLHLVLDRLGPFEAAWRGQKIGITCSAGWKQFVAGDRPEDMLAAADQALYENKRSGKKSPLPGPVLA
ncbi:MAG TPA: GGDEF domain-containing protein [Candidatus Sulfotelmatobacter sp.]|nr:GGDEF domain-containing protein [Candidatus Sulfotelmatobacter sp.]